MNLEEENERLEEIKEDVRSRYPDTPWMDVYSDLVWRGDSPTAKTQLHGKQAVVGVDIKTGEETTFCVASQQYQIVRPELALHRFENSLKDFEEYGTPEITIKVFGGGAKWMTEALFPEKVDINGRKVSPRAFQKNSLDLGWEYSHGAGAYDWICSNGMVAGYLAHMCRKKHRLSLDIDIETAQLTSAMSHMSEQFGIWNTWAKKQLDQAKAETFLTALPISEKQTEEIRALPEHASGETVDSFLRNSKLNVLNLHHIVTQYFTHEVDESVSRLEREEKIGRIFHQEALKVKS